MVVVNVRVPEPLYTAFKERTESEYSTVSAQIRRLMFEWAERKDGQ